MILRLLLLVGCMMIVNILSGQELEEYKWKNRILIIESTSKSDIIYRNQIDEFLNSEDELADRKLVIFEVIGKRFRKIDFSNPDEVLVWTELKEYKNSDFKIPSKFKVTLIGLDGGIKATKENVMKKNELFQMIDAMPMRKWELDKQ